MSPNDGVCVRAESADREIAGWSGAGEWADLASTAAADPLSA